MGTILSSSSAHAATKCQKSHSDYYANFSDVPRLVYPDRLNDGFSLNDSLHTDITESSRPYAASNKSTSGSGVSYASVSVSGKPSFSDSFSTSGPVGVRRGVFPSLTKKTKTPASDPTGSGRVSFRSQSEGAEEDLCDAVASQSKLPTEFNIYQTRSTCQQPEELHRDSRKAVANLNRDYEKSTWDINRANSCREKRTNNLSVSCRSGTPYFRPQDTVRPMCSAYKHIPASFYISTPGNSQTSRKYSDTNSSVFRPIENGPRLRQFRFNQRRQLSEPNPAAQKRHSHCVSKPLYTNERDNNPDAMRLNCHPLTHDYDSNCVYPQNTTRRRSSFTFNTCDCHEVQHFVAEHQLAPTSFTNGYKAGTPAIHSCSYQSGFAPYSFAELSLDSKPPARCVPSPHPVAAHRIHSSVYPSPVYPQSPYTPEENIYGSLTHKSHTRLARRFTELHQTPPDRPVYDRAPYKESNRYKNLTKSISCYALKFFGNQQAQLRSRVVGKSDFSSLATLRTRAEKTKRKAVERNPSGKQTSIFAKIVDKPKLEQQAEREERISVERPVYSNMNRYDKHCFPYTTRTVTSQMQTQKQDVLDRIIDEVPSYRHSYVESIPGSVPTQSCNAEYRDPNENGCWIMCSSAVPQCALKLSPGLKDPWIGQDNHQLHSMFSRVPDPRHTLFKASTSELLRCLSLFITARIQLSTLSSPARPRTGRLRTIQPSMIVGWIKAIDRALLVQGWSELAFINPAHVVFLFMMLKECLDCNVTTERELHSIVMVCLYLSYSYMGNEISYPLKPFLVAETNQLLIQNDGVNRKQLEGENALVNGYESSIRAKVIDQVRNRFWQYCLRIINAKSSDMLQINANPMRFTELFSELKSYDSLVVPICVISTPK
ncbi:hypothetical protein P879_09536 [Paragonimus westermani]|uniref:Cyclin-dependent kinase 5 activator 1 n=1 Tax=Paragonimus westermani TaxID=34504 RepID=A0A8T0D9G5_9TREM|nr:hypothetical protein P879_09536 [Paragonimus westermani]